jgi:hypothetical protein
MTHVKLSRGLDAGAQCALVEGQPETPRSIEVNVVFTTFSGTVAALRTASKLARGLHATIRLLIVQTVPFALPLDRPPVSPEFIAQRCCCLAIECGEAAEVSVEIYLCRNRRRILQRVLMAHSLVVLGGTNRWWRTAEQKVANLLASNGHHVIFVDLRSRSLLSAGLAQDGMGFPASGFLPDASSI